nr:hypothetical protein [Tanacetum cinerariifolium]
NTRVNLLQLEKKHGSTHTHTNFTVPSSSKPPQIKCLPPFQ